MKVEITAFAQTQLNDIYYYYAAEVSENTASRLINKILDAVEELAVYSTLGTKEPLLTHLNLNHKYIVAGNYKIIFRSEAEIIYITDIFDCRQDPKKIVARNKE